MKKIFILGFLAAAAMGFGCALTNYDLIVDNDQGGVVNTNGKAYVRQSSQVVTIWPDGNDNLIWFVDQKANGDRTLTTYNYATSVTGDPYMDDLYCSPDWNGCAITSADDPQVGDVDDFDYRYNANCSGFRSLSLLVSTTRYYGECGRASATDRSMRMIGLANEMTPVQYKGATWLRTTLSALNTSMVLNNNNGSAYAVPMTSQIGVLANFPQRRLVLDVSNPNNRNLAQSAINWNSAHPGPFVTATVSIEGQPTVFRVKANGNANAWPQIHF
jgi:hypothetical protein